MRILTIETTCDETAAAVVDDQLQVHSAVVASQDELHQRFGGIVPELASRAHVERILPVIDEALRRANVTLTDLSAVAVATSPGLAGSLLVGLAAAKGLCVATGLPLVAIDHLQAHIYAAKIASGEEIYPCIGLIVSGGHTNLYRCDGPLTFEWIGATIDDAAGEAFDKVASMLNLPYPGGPAIQRVAERGDPAKYAFPRSLVDEPDRLEFSFSGLKTAVRYAISRNEPPHIAAARLSEQEIADLAASFQAAVVDALVAKSLAALRVTGFRTLCVGGGVAANRPFREALTAACEARGHRLFIAPPALCTDNAVMGAIAFEHLKAGQKTELDADITPGLIRRRRNGA